VTEPSAILIADDLARLSPHVSVVDVRWRLGGPPGRNDYEAGHIPGAAFLDLDGELCGRPGAGGRHPLPDPATLQHALRAAGIEDHKPVVAYDAGDGMAAARLWWTLRWAGHSDVRVLDGGWPAWVAAGLPVVTGSESPAPGHFTVRPGQLPVLDAAAAAKIGTLLDARTAVRFRGESEPIDPVAGHIPGARNVPYADLVDATGRLRAPEQLRQRFAEAGVGAGEIGAYCGSGVTAAHTLLALHEAGFDNAALYVGSWSHWITDPAREIGRGTA